MKIRAHPPTGGGAPSEASTPESAVFADPSTAASGADPSIGTGGDLVDPSAAGMGPFGLVVADGKGESPLPHATTKIALEETTVLKPIQKNVGIARDDRFNGDLRSLEGGVHWKLGPMRTGRAVIARARRRSTCRRAESTRARRTARFEPGDPDGDTVARCAHVGGRLGHQIAHPSIGPGMVENRRGHEQPRASIEDLRRVSVELVREREASKRLVCNDESRRRRIRANGALQHHADVSIGSRNKRFVVRRGGRLADDFARDEEIATAGDQRLAGATGRSEHESDEKTKGANGFHAEALQQTVSHRGTRVVWQQTRGSERVAVPACAASGRPCVTRVSGQWSPTGVARLEGSDLGAELGLATASGEKGHWNDEPERGRGRAHPWADGA